MASPAILSLAVLALISYLHSPGAVLLRARRQADREEGPGSELRESQCYQCSQALQKLIHPSDSHLMTDEAWVRDKCREGEAAYQCLQSEACLQDEHRDDFQVKVHENFCSNIEGVVALAVCWEDQGFVAIGQFCNEYSHTHNPDNLTMDSYEESHCRNLQLTSECMLDKAEACPPAARDLMAGETAIFIEAFCP